MAKEDNPVFVVSTAKELKQLLGGAPTAADANTPEPKIVTTEHEVTIAGQRVPYAATCGTLEVTVDDPDEPAARVFYTAYVRSDVEQPARRPLTFCFNGGPGSSSIWLHMGCLGPRRVRLDASSLPRPPARAEDNARSLLDVTDLVFIDPVGTGFSKPHEGTGEPYHQVDGDVKSVGEFIRQYVTANARWESPKFLAGESYGTTRAAGLAYYLQSRHGLALNGLVMVSLALQFQCFWFRPGHDLPFVLFLPAYAATAVYHGKVQVDDVHAFVKEAEQFALHEYGPALMKGSRLTEHEQQALAERLAHFTGLSPTYLRQCNHRVSLDRFTKELLRDRRQTVGRLDARFVGNDADAAGDTAERDPSYLALLAAFASAFLHDLRTHLKFDVDEAYELLNLDVNSKWAYGQDNGFLDVTKELRDAMLDNPHLRVFVASGLYDLATPPFAADYTLSHLHLEPEAQAAIQHVVYPSGHMMYIHEESMDALRSDLLAFYEGSHS